MLIKMSSFGHFVQLIIQFRPKVDLGRFGNKLYIIFMIFEVVKFRICTLGDITPVAALRVSSVSSC